MASMTLYSARSCPFAQRTRLVLHEKGLDCDLVEIDLKQTPDWFLEISPYGKVPLLLHDGERIWESTVINEYLEELFPEPPLLPAHAARRALARIWIDYANNYLVPQFYKLLLAQEAESRKAIATRLGKRLVRMATEGPGGKDGGPWWLGEMFTLADIAFYPFFERFPALAHYRALQRWLDAMQARPSVIAHGASAEFHVKTYAPYADGSANGSTAQEMREA